MAPSYTDVKNVDLGKLNSMIAGWKDLPEDFADVATTFGTEVEKGLRNSDFEGEAAEAAFESFRTVKYQISASASEARNVRALVRNARDEIKAAKEGLEDIVDQLKGHDHLSVNSHDGTVYVDPDKLDDPSHQAPLQRSYQDLIRSYRERTGELLERAAKADSGLKWALTDLSSYTMGFNNGAYNSLKDAARSRREQGKGGGKISLKEMSDREVTTRANNAPGANSLKKQAEILSFKPLITGFEQGTKGGDPVKGLQTASGWVPSFAAGEGLNQTSKRLHGGGRHRADTWVNRMTGPTAKAAGWGAKVFGWPVSFVATGIDFAYTPEYDPEEKMKKSRVMAPDAPERQKWPVNR